ncbi:atp-dependent rna helicase [Musa troglodytarum]|uniref:Atp-dependent rna helicase n=1 Tax=Musa troglodytarum TaxID=320322 RepID=A0A9E7K9N7_9LILI|nr:atp-dependent rna helicase [Musa troglodytarum]
MRHSTLAKKGLVIINMGFLIGKDDPTVGHPLYCEIRQVERHDAKLSERMFTHVPILIEKIVPYRDHLNSTDIR